MPNKPHKAKKNGILSISNKGDRIAKSFISPKPKHSFLRIFFIIMLNRNITNIVIKNDADIYVKLILRLYDNKITANN